MEQALKIKYRVGGMDCGSCVAKIENAVKRLPGVEQVGVSLSSGTMTILPGPNLTAGVIERQVKALGFSIALAETAVFGSPGTSSDPLATNSTQHVDVTDGPWWRTRKAMLTAAVGLALALTYIAHLVFPAVPQWIFVPALMIGLVPVGRRALVAATTGTPFSIEMLMTIAAVGALFIGAAEEAVAVVFLFLVGELLEGVAAGRARASIRGLADLVPKTALVETNGVTEEVPADRLVLGSTILVRPGDRIAADGEITEGSSAIDEAPVTGESVPKQKGVGDTVFAGTINTDAVLRVKVTAVSGDNTISRVIRLVEEAQDSKAPTQRFIDKFSTYYTPAVLVVAALVAVIPPLFLGGSWQEWIYKGLAILLIGCPCSLVISTPAAIAAGLSAGARRGLLMKGGTVLENLRRVTLVALDKTGTLTEGKPKVTDIIPVGRSHAQILSMAAALESGSSHPLAMAILERAKTEKVPVPPAFASKAIPGKGVSGSIGGEQAMLLSPKAVLAETPIEQALLDQIDSLNAEGKTVSILLAGNSVAGMIAIRDEPRDDAKSGLQMLKQAQIGAVMLTGDNQRTAEAIGDDLGIDVRAGLLPEDKQKIVREKQSQGFVVAKVGDGINDAPALAAADIGIAMGGGTDIALETADAAILHGRVSDIANMIDLSHATMGNIWQNITVALSLKAVFLITTVIGVTGLWPAILADTGATVLVTMNAMRLLAWKGKVAE
ncbi:heavy metal translocating P-type ATPase [Agrobacterium sp. lyk4-40-TYG-31]|uniref:heavy metal translocating P-type ATPase n=1 Tax=Agrobacterium sp. lyk4-40-TYG-31 TaxID=3040276 RepID=UPI00254BB6FB|nr:heavy metal translocating P-type ATPase [Agrobacterium sp. lyk4-40-TYG-31]